MAMNVADPASDPYGLQRFVDAQARVHDSVRAELREGCKRSHWMWFVFPQLEGLGGRPMARRYAIRSLAEARAYLAHPVLGARLLECTRLVNALRGRHIEDIFGYPDDLKFRSSMTLFAHAGGGDEFQDALQRHFGGAADPLTLERLARRRDLG